MSEQARFQFSVSTWNVFKLPSDHLSTEACRKNAFSIKELWNNNAQC